MSGAPLRVHRLIRDGMVVCLDAEARVFASGYVAIDNSRIVDVGPMATCPYRADAEVDASDCLVLPGLVNSHGHLVQSLFRGLGDEMAPSAWLDGMVFPMSRALTRDRAYHGARLALLELIRSGVTTTADCHFTHVHPDSIDGVLEAVRESTLRAVVVRGAMDGDGVPPDFQEEVSEALGDVERLRAKWESDRVRIAVEPLGVHRCSEAMVRAFHAWARANGTRMHLHLATSPAEVDYVRARHGCRPIEYLDRLGVLDGHVLAVHCVQATEGELELLARRGIPVSHNPASNAYLGYGIFPLARFLALGGVVGLGVDGAASNNGQNLLESMKLALLLQKAALRDASFGSARLALELATRGSARTLGLDAVAGSLEAGKSADLVLMSLRQPHLAPHERVLSNLVYAGPATQVKLVMVAGEVVFRDGRSTVFDDDEVIDMANRAQREILTAGRDRESEGR